MDHLLDVEPAKPLDFPNWGIAVRAAAIGHGVTTLNITTDHHIQPRNLIGAVLKAVLPDMRPGILIAAAKTALAKGITTLPPGAGGMTKDDYEALLVDLLLSQIYWARGNVIPGPPSDKRLDDPKDTGGVEQPLALTGAYQYGAELMAALRGLKPTDKASWDPVIALLKNDTAANVAARQNIDDWADAWGTHPVYPIYVRLTQQETTDARANPVTRVGVGAWILADQPLLKSCGDKLAHWEGVLATADLASRPAVITLMKADVGHGCTDQWLVHHP